MIKCAKCNINSAKMHPIFGPTWCDSCTEPPTFSYKGKKIKDIEYFDGGNVRQISKAMLQQIKSAVVTHEGESLYGRSAQKYMDNYSERYLGKNLSGSYRDERI